ncbi:MAG: hypothetical protein KDA85_15095 [Planctomycetaceae bacterium]|nr:hypothetical protein [Planctomycetaceae bacterium]
MAPGNLRSEISDLKRQLSFAWPP